MVIDQEQYLADHPRPAVKSGNSRPPAQKVEIRIDRQRLADEVTVDEFIAMQEGDLRTVKNVIGRFVVGDDGIYLDPQEGRRIVGNMTLTQLIETNQEFIRRAESAAVPPESGAG